MIVSRRARLDEGGERGLVGRVLDHLAVLRLERLGEALLRVRDALRLRATRKNGSIHVSSGSCFGSTVQCIGRPTRRDAYLQEAELHFEQTELPALEAGGLLERRPELHEVERRHRLEDRELVDQQLRAALSTVHVTNHMFVATRLHYYCLYCMCMYSMCVTQQRRSHVLERDVTSGERVVLLIRFYSILNSTQFSASVNGSSTR